MTDRLNTKIAVVTGGSSGIGAGIVRAFLREGASVINADLQPLSANDLAELPDADARLRFIRTDVTREQDVATAIGLAVETWGRLDVTVACAGIPGEGADVDLTEGDWDKVMNINAKGVFFVTKHAVPEMVKAGGGSIINISSVYGIKGAPGFAAYGASKGAIRTFTKSTAIAHARERIRANSIHPGTIETPGLQAIFERTGDADEARKRFSAEQPGGFNGTPDDIGWACVFLASDESRFVNGVELPIDGGMLAK